MAQRDTMIPVCKIIMVGPTQLVEDIPLTNTGVGYEEIRYGIEPSCMPNQVMPVIVSAHENGAGVDGALPVNWVSGTASVHIEQGKITSIQPQNPGLFDFSIAASAGLQPLVITPEAQLSSISLGPRTIKYKNSIGTVITSSSPNWQRLGGNIASGFDGATTMFGVSAGQDSSAIVELTYHQHGGTFTTRIISPGVWAKGLNPQRTGYNYKYATAPHNKYGLDDIDALSGVITQVGDRNGGMFDLSSSWYEEVSSFNGDASVGFFMVSSYVSNPFAARFSNPMASPNYVTVTDLSGGDGYFWVKPSLGAAYASGSPAGIAVSSLKGWDNQGASGIPGVFAAAGTTAVLSVADGISHISIMNSLDVSTGFAINYGVIKQSNTIGDGLHPDVR